MVLEASGVQNNYYENIGRCTNVVRRLLSSVSYSNMKIPTHLKWPVELCRLSWTRFKKVVVTERVNDFLTHNDYNETHSCQCDWVQSRAVHGLEKFFILCRCVVLSPTVHNVFLCLFIACMFVFVYFACFSATVLWWNVRFVFLGYTDKSVSAN